MSDHAGYPVYPHYPPYGKPYPHVGKPVYPVYPMYVPTSGIVAVALVLFILLVIATRRWG
ncbi:MAG: hypothetical protein BLM47_10285 [Candidatus Reconcilbacillus cellulovorans]|uniref:Uncharacterized protein n=1 Tax=Candidatus Reconcilbacillus cellulovorans TaxID=1906605 RepID=A0A2A6DZE7_9BACL|nr:MAG: hypothetical protein BLM47_10285 [Candidatus Reconcilbacillus cellulovorans]